MDLKDPISLTAATVLLPLSVVTVVVNSLVIITIWKDPFKQLNGTANYLILNLAVCDMLVGIPGEFLFALLHWAPGSNIGTVAYISMYFGFNASFLTILGLAVERLIVISSPLNSEDYLTSTYLAIGILSIWFLSGMLTFLPVLSWPNSKERYRLFISDAIGIPILILLCFCYGRIYFLVRKSLHQNLSTAPVCVERQSLTASAEEIQKLKRKERSVAYSVFILVGLFAACWIPSFVLQNVHEFCDSCISKEHISYCEASTILLHPLVNPIAYSLRTVKFRRALKRTILSCCSCESPRKAIV